MEEFTPESLREFLRQPRNPRFEEQSPPSAETPAAARTARARRIAEILSNAGGAHGATAGRESVAALDGAVRQNLAELVRQMMEAQRFAELESMLDMHARFIGDIQKLLQRNRSEG